MGLPFSFSSSVLQIVHWKFFVLNSGHALYSSIFQLIFLSSVVFSLFKGNGPLYSNQRGFGVEVPKDLLGWF